MTQADSAPADSVTAVKCELAGEVLRSFGKLCFAATGWSMLPAIWPGDTLAVERVGHDQFHVGDVVLTGREGRLCAHRVVARAENSGNPHWITQGDAMTAPDHPVSESELLGRVAYVIRKGRLVAVPARLSVIQYLLARTVRRSVPAARALVYLHNYLDVHQRQAMPAPEKSVSPCQV
jgi:signal peptidase I